MKARLVEEREKRDSAKREASKTRVMGKNVTGRSEPGAAAPIRFPQTAPQTTTDRRGPMTEGVQSKLAEMRYQPKFDPATLSPRGRRMLGMLG